MNSYKRFKLSAITIILLGLTHLALAQDKGNLKPLKKEVKQLTGGLSKLSNQLTNELKAIDTRAIVSNAKAIALASKVDAEKLVNQWTNCDVEQTDSSFQTDIETNTMDQSRTIQKVYIISKNTPLAINNRYGKVEVKTWTKNEIRVDITVRAVDADGSKAQDLLNSVVIDETKSANNISLTTQIGQGKSNWWSAIVSGKNRGVQVNYSIYLPSGNQLSIENAYGDVLLPDLTGNVDLTVSYGNLTAGRLSGNETTIKAGYLQAKISAIKNAALRFEYGKLALDEVNNLDLSIAYCGNSNIGTITGSGKIKMEYSGGFKVGLGKSIRNFTLNTAYSSSNIHIDPVARFMYQVEVSYCDFNPGKSTVTKEEPDPASRGPKLHKSYTGYYGDKTSANRVTINSDYGSITFD
ncbi:hypothetical protein GCM10023231_36390 [Olivibacter ginsenosidimutans]|uniref:Adhesin domain-containing protein n=1 Tax=Olivibacter ginsenosidimutans TaxID=1176537 RepID=A0ABP9C2F9_9SPHI